MAEKVVNYEVASCKAVNVNGELKGFTIFCPATKPTGTHALQKTWPISKSSGKTRTGASTKGRQVFALEPLNDGRLASFTGSVFVQSTPSEKQAAIDAGITNS